MNLQEAIAQMVTDTGYEFVACEVVSHPKGKLVRLLADKAGGISVGDLQRLSKQLNSELLVEFPEMADYLLEVSSPGLAEIDLEVLKKAKKAKQDRKVIKKERRLKKKMNNVDTQSHLICSEA